MTLFLTDYNAEFREIGAAYKKSRKRKDLITTGVAAGGLGVAGGGIGYLKSPDAVQIEQKDREKIYRNRELAKGRTLRDINSDIIISKQKFAPEIKEIRKNLVNKKLVRGSVPDMETLNRRVDQARPRSTALGIGAGLALAGAGYGIKKAYDRMRMKREK